VHRSKSCTLSANPSEHVLTRNSAASCARARECQITFQREPAPHAETVPAMQIMVRGSVHGSRSGTSNRTATPCRRAMSTRMQRRSCAGPLVAAAVQTEASLERRGCSSSSITSTTRCAAPEVWRSGSLATESACLRAIRLSAMRRADSASLVRRRLGMAATTSCVLLRAVLCCWAHPRFLRAVLC
jgi:hypothetical protein